MLTAVLRVSAVVLSVTVGAAVAQEQAPVPPHNAVRLSQIVGEVEKRDGFQYIDEVDWDNDAYVVTYYTSDKAKVEMRFDPVSGKPK